MNIGYLHRDYWPPKEGSSLQSWQIYKRLSKTHTVYTPYTCPFPRAKHAYNRIFDTRQFLHNIDIVFVIVDGVFDFFHEKFTVLPTIVNIKKPVVWLLNAPIEESMYLRHYSHAHMFYADKIKRRAMSSFVDMCICVSKNLASYAEKNLQAKQHTVIPNGADPKIFQIRRNKKRKQQFQVFWAGSGKNPWQAIDVIYNTAKILLTQDLDIQFTLFTDGVWMKKPPPINVRIESSVQYKHMPELLSRADCVLCLYHDIFPYGLYFSPLKLFEAMCAGIPVIATDAGQAQEVIKHGKTGFLCKNNPEEIASTILQIKRNPQSAAHIGKQARFIVRSSYSWNHTVRKIQTVLQRL